MSRPRRPVDAVGGLRRPTMTPDAELRGARGRLAVLRRRRRPELGHHPEHRDAPCRRAAPRALERGGHRGRVGVVGVVEDPGARRGRVTSSIRRATARRRASPATTASSGTPAASAAAAAASALVTWWRPRDREADVGVAPRRAQPERRAQSSSSVTSSARTSPASLPERAGPRRRCGRPSPRPAVVGVEHRGAVGGQRLDQLALGPGDVVDACRTLEVGAGHDGHDADRRAGRRRTAARCGRRRGRPSRRPRPRCPSGALTSVSGTPSSLLNDRSLAAVRERRWPRTAASRSLVDVLPTEPVMPTTRSRQPVRASRPRSSSARAVSSTRIAVAGLDAARLVR